MTQVSFQLQRGIENPIIHFRNIVGKISYIASLFLKLAFLIVGTAGLGFVVNAVATRWFNYQIDWKSVYDQASSIGWVQAAVIVVLLVIIRRIVIRLGLPDTRLNPDR
jgi:hypothetical protein